MSCKSKMLCEMFYFDHDKYNYPSKHGGLITYIHNSCSYVKSDIEINSNLFQSSLIKVYPTSNKTVKYLIGNLYRIRSDLIDETDRWIHSQNYCADAHQ